MSPDTARNRPVPLLLISLNELRLLEFPDRSREQTSRRIGQYLINIDFGSLQYEMWVLPSVGRDNMSILILGAELSQPFGHSRDRAQGTIAQYLRQGQSDDHIL
jgi:hypothetical protein